MVLRWQCALWALPLLILGCASETAFIPHEVHSHPGLIYVDEDALVKYLKQYGYNWDGIYDYWEDTRGDVVYICDSPASMPQKLFLLMANRKVPTCIELPDTGRTYWVDDQGKVVYLPPYAISEDDRDTYTMIDRQSGYFFQIKSKSRIVYVGQIQRKDGFLFSFQATSGFWPSQICGANDHIYLLDHGDDWGPAWYHSSKNCWVFSPDPKQPNDYLKTELCVAGFVDLVSPGGTELVCDSYASMPLFFSTPFLYDASMGSARELPDTVPIVEFFLDGDWLNPLLTENMK
jgi:hypothetical protein